METSSWLALVLGLALDRKSCDRRLVLRVRVRLERERACERRRSSSFMTESVRECG
jgi:hypothetical protein